MLRVDALKATASFRIVSFRKLSTHAGGYTRSKDGDHILDLCRTMLSLKTWVGFARSDNLCRVLGCIRQDLSSAYSYSTFLMSLSCLFEVSSFQELDCFG